MRKTIKELLAEANAQVTTVPAVDAIPLVKDDSVLFVDIRDTTERLKTGAIPKAAHVPRGSLEFAIDPDSALHNPIFSSGKRILFY